MNSLTTENSTCFSVSKEGKIEGHSERIKLEKRRSAIETTFQCFILKLDLFFIKQISELS